MVLLARYYRHGDRGAFASEPQSVGNGNSWLYMRNVGLTMRTSTFDKAPWKGSFKARICEWDLAIYLAYIQCDLKPSLALDLQK